MALGAGAAQLCVGANRTILKKGHTTETIRPVVVRDAALTCTSVPDSQLWIQVLVCRGSSGGEGDPIELPAPGILFTVKM